jgi:2-polyprenyl-3-methyl-5-hydroxy-6-metoxy-1,4-benzoquinol methylase
MSELAGCKHGVAERFVGDVMRRTLGDAEHLARYRWAAQFARGRRVLDAGCGTAYGSELLATEGAAEVVGVDIAHHVLDAVRPSVADAVRLDVADVCQLPYADGAFDLVVCFNVIEHLDHPRRALDELARVLAADGLLLVSTPNRWMHAPASPHHRCGYSPDELRQEVQSRLGQVRMMRQCVYLTVAVLGDGVELGKVVLDDVPSGELDTEEFAVAVASRVGLPEVAPLAMAASALQVKTWLAALGYHEARAAADHARFLELEQQTAERDRAVARAERAERMLSAVTSSSSWRVTAPLRGLKNAASPLWRRIGGARR